MKIIFFCENKNNDRSEFHNVRVSQIENRCFKVHRLKVISRRISNHRVILKYFIIVMHSRLRRLDQIKLDIMKIQFQIYLFQYCLKDQVTFSSSFTQRQIIRVKINACTQIQYMQISSLINLINLIQERKVHFFKIVKWNVKLVVTFKCVSTKSTEFDKKNIYNNLLVK